jgi:hypothetical protein
VTTLKKSHPITGKNIHPISGNLLLNRRLLAEKVFGAFGCFKAL